MVMLGLGLTALLSSCQTPQQAQATVQDSESPPPSAPGGGSGGSGGPTAGCVNATASQPNGDCSAQGFAAALFAYINVPDTAANEFAMETWEAAEGGAFNNTAYCNPLDTTQTEPGSHVMSGGNTAGVQAYITSDGHTCWYWGVKANGDTLTSGYPTIMSVLKNPSSSTSTQCQALEQAVVTPQPFKWGTSPYTC
jgi:hypothetical protein